MKKLSEIKELYINGINHIGQIENIVKNKKENIIARYEKISSVTSKIDVIIDSVKGIKATDLNKINTYRSITSDNHSKQDVKKIIEY